MNKCHNPLAGLELLVNNTIPTASDLVYDIATYAFCSLKRIQFSNNKEKNE
ncbi:MAG: hypothetical protein WAL42_11280 [Nitrososphaeraceae archaeon]